MSKARKIMEYAIIVLAVMIITSIAAISIYRSVINSDRYNEIKTLRSFEEMTERINQTENIDHIEIENEVVTDAPSELFDDLVLKEYKMVNTSDAAQMHFKDKWIVIVYKDNTYDVLSVTENNEIYWGYYVETECPSLVKWLSEH